MVKGARRPSTTVKLADNPRITAMVKATLADIKLGSFIGVTAMPQPDGSQKAIGLHIFMDAQRGISAGALHALGPRARQHHDQCRRPNLRSAGVDGSDHDGEIFGWREKDHRSAQYAGRCFRPGQRQADLKPGAQFIIIAAPKNADGTLERAGR